MGWDMEGAKSAPQPSLASGEAADHDPPPPICYGQRHPWVTPPSTATPRTAPPCLYQPQPGVTTQPCNHPLPPPLSVPIAPPEPK